MSTFKEKKIYFKLKQKDKDAFIEFYDLYVDRIYRFIYFKVGNKEEAEDLVSLTFLKTWNHLLENKLTDAKTLRALVYRIARNAIIDHYRKNLSHENVSLDDEDITLNLSDNSDKEIVRDVDLKIDRHDIEEKLKELKDEYREIIILKFIEEFSVSEIAEIIDKPRGNVRVLMHRALKALRGLYGDK